MIERISAVIPTYNRAALLGRALRSIFSQTRIPDEIIVVDDGSNDNTAEVVARFADPRLRYIRQENAGPSAARNTGIAQASGDWVAFCDSDDEWLPAKLQRQVLALQDNPDIGLCFTDSGWTCNGQVRETSVSWTARRATWAKATRWRRGQAGRFTGRHFRQAHAQIGVVGNLSTVLIARWVIEQVGPFRTDLFVAEDYEMWLRASRATDLWYIDEQLAWAHGQETSLCVQDDLQETFRQSWRKVCLEAIACEEDAQVREQFQRTLAVSWETTIWDALASHEPARLRQAIRAVRADGWAPSAITRRLIRWADRFGPSPAILAHRLLARLDRV